MKKGPPTMTPPEKDDYAWNRIVTLIVGGFFEMAKTIFLTRCAESAQEALADGEKRRAAFQNLFDAVALAEKTAEDETKPQKDVEAYTRNVLFKMEECRKVGIKELDALTPATQEKD